MLLGVVRYQRTVFSLFLHRRAGAKRTSQSLELISHRRECERVRREVARDGELERRRVGRELELPRLSKRLDDGRMEDKSLHRKPRQVESPAPTHQLPRHKNQRRSETHHSLPSSPTR